MRQRGQYVLFTSMGSTLGKGVDFPACAQFVALSVQPCMFLWIVVLSLHEFFWEQNDDQADKHAWRVY